MNSQANETLSVNVVLGIGMLGHRNRVSSTLAAVYCRRSRLASARASAWRHADLLNSPYPRPYQYEAFDVFRRSGYRSTLVESPTGSGKTLIGMLCIGIAFAFVERHFGGANRTATDFAVAVSLTFALTYPESNIAILWGGLIYSTIAVYVPAALLRKV